MVDTSSSGVVPRTVVAGPAALQLLIDQARLNIALTEDTLRLLDAQFIGLRDKLVEERNLLAEQRLMLEDLLKQKDAQKPKALPDAPGTWYWEEWKSNVVVYKKPRGRYMYVKPPGGVEVLISPRIAGGWIAVPSDSTDRSHADSQHSAGSKPAAGDGVHSS